MAGDPSDGLIDRIYEAAAIPDLWPSVLQDIARVGQGYATLLFVAEGKDFRWLGSPGAHSFMPDYVAEGWPARTDRAARLFAAKHHGFLGDLDVYTAEEMDSEPVFTEFLRPRGLGWGAATALPMPTGEMIAFDVEINFDHGPVNGKTLDRLDLLRPHLARASLISSRLAFERVKSATQTLELMGLPAGVLGRRGQLLAANSSFETLMPRVVMEGRDRLALSDKLADALFAGSLPELSASAYDTGVRSIPIGAQENLPPLILHLVPIRGLANDLFVNASAILVVTPVEPQKVPTAELLQGLFDLTPAEARAARGIAGGQTLDEIARAHGLSKETVRTQLKSTLAKTGMGRQTDLARLLAGIVPLGAR